MAAAARTSRGQGATRWFTIRWLTTTSHPSISDGSVPNDMSSEMLVPTSVCRIGAPSSSAAAGSTITGSGSYSTKTNSAESGPWYFSSVTMAATGSPTKRVRPLARNGRTIPMLIIGIPGVIGSRSMSSAA